MFVNIAVRYSGFERWGGQEAIDGTEEGLYTAPSSSSWLDTAWS